MASKSILEIIKENMGLVEAEAQKMFYVLQGSDSNMEIEDLIQEGTIGLYKAAESFDNTINVIFSVYATPIIRQNIKRAVYNQSRLVKIPENQFEDYAKIQKAMMDLKKIYPTESVIDYKIISIKTGIPLQKIINIVQRIEGGRNTVSLNTFINPYSEDESDEKIDFVEDQKINPLDEIIFKETQSAVIEMLKFLNPREQIVIIKRFGLDGNEPRSLNAIGKELDCSGERARQIVHQALNKLRHETTREIFNFLQTY